MEEKKIDAKQTKEKPRTKRKLKTWGDKGFTGKVQFGCYEYKIKFVPEIEILKFAEAPASIQKMYGVVSCDDQVILIGSDLSEQTQKLSLLHELTHMIFLNNNVGLSEEKFNITSEELVDNVAARYMELMRRNPDLMRWLLR